MSEKAPGGRARENRKFTQAPSPEIWSETISGCEEVLAGKLGGLFWATSLGKIIGSVTALISFRLQWDGCSSGREVSGSLYAKVLDAVAGIGNSFYLRFTSVFPEIDRLFEVQTANPRCPLHVPAKQRRGSRS